MIYNWQQKDWPDFKYQLKQISSPQLSFGLKSGKISGVLLDLPQTTQREAIIDMMVAEAIKTSEIEGELLNRLEVMSSIKINLGVHDKHPKQVKDLRAKGIAELMVSIRKTYNEPLTKRMLFAWYELLMMGNSHINSGKWRKSNTPMQVISGTIGKEIIHFEAPPSSQLPNEMSKFIKWYNRTAPGKANAIDNSLIRSAVVHLYFESIHPFEDGNGRIGRALSEKILSQGIGQPIFISLSTTIEGNKKLYYKALKQAQRSNEITLWLKYFIKTILDAQKDAEKMVHFSVKKARFYDQHQNVLSKRQTKVINRILQEGPKGFKGGITAKKYMVITKTSKATATRDLQELSEQGIFIPSGGGRNISYELKL